MCSGVHIASIRRPVSGRIPPEAFGFPAILERNANCSTARLADPREVTDRQPMNSPPVSVVIPCFNQGRFLREALQSVRAQTVPPRQVVVVDDGSTDDTAEVARSFPGGDVEYVRQPNRGLASARNRGIEAATGEYLVFLDADDRLRPEAVAIGIRELEARPECAFVFGRCTRIDERGEPLPTAAPPPLDGDAYVALLRTNWIWTPAVVMFRRRACAPWLRFDPSMSASADYDLYLRIARHAPVHGHGQLVAEYRLHATSMSGDPAVMLRSTVRALNAQRRHLRTDAERRACEEGLRSFRHYYGQQVAARIVSQWHRPANWPALVRGVLVLLRCHPGGVLRETGRSMGLLRRRSAPAASGTGSGARA
ncbi:MAG TPA: glycosyltransferase [Vicinamibacterales bacterium]|nr:glycosyltransferase [Vicinamibacterales bacterium]